MAISAKTISYAIPAGASATNNTLTPLSQITIYIPEASASIKSAWIEVTADDIVTSGGASVNVRQIDLSLGGATAESSTCISTITNSAENISWIVSREFTSYFQTNWSGPSMTCDISVLFNQFNGTPVGLVNLCSLIFITYEYDDTDPTHIKSVSIPLDAPRAGLPATKTSHDTIPALDTYLPEASKVYRNIYIVTRSNRNHSTNADFTISLELSSLGVLTTQPYEGAATSGPYSRYVWALTSYIAGSTGSTHSFDVWADISDRYDGMQAWMVVTYEFDPSTTTRVMNSLLLPTEFDSPMGGTTAADYQRSFRDFWMPEENPSIERIACLVNWGAIVNEVGLAARVGTTGSFLSYTNTGSAVICGDKTMMIRNDAPAGLTFSKGRNRLSVDIYNTSDVNRGLNVGCLWIVNYTSDVSSSGISANNKTLLYSYGIGSGPSGTLGTGCGNYQQQISSPTPFVIPESRFFITGLGYEFRIITNGGNNFAGLTIGVERLESEGGLYWEPAYADAGGNDTEVGIFTKYAQSRSIFQRWTNDADTNRLVLSVSRRYRTWLPWTVNSTGNHEALIGYITYHSDIKTVGGTVSGSAGATVSLSLHRASTGETVLTDSQIGDGPFSFDWYDDTENVFVSAYESASLKGISKIDTAGSGFDIALSSGGGESSHTWFG
jgi:hypothetical protein